MKTPLQLTGSHLRTYEKLFQHPISHNLEWHDLLETLGQLGEITEEHNGHVNFARNGHLLVLHKPHTKDVTDSREILALRHFLEQSEITEPATDHEGDFIVAISHHEARVFRSEKKGTPAAIVKSEESRYFNHASDSKDSARAKELPAAASYFEPLVEALKGANKILLCGAGSGKASEKGSFETWLKTHHADLAERVVGSIVIDENHLTNGDVLAKGREFYAELAASYSDAN